MVDGKQSGLVGVSSYKSNKSYLELTCKIFLYFVSFIFDEQL